MKFFKLKDLAKSWSVWVLGAVTVTPILNDNVAWLADLVPEPYKGYFITALGVIGLIARAVVQPKLDK